MPTATGKLQLVDYDNELISAGFDSFDQLSRYRYINWGYRHVARKFPWMWERTSAAVVLAPGAVSIDVSPTSVTVPNFRSVGKAYITSPVTSRARLRPLKDDDFFEKWLPLNLTDAGNWGNPDSYYVYENQLYILRPPSIAMTVTIHYYQRPTDLASSTDTPLTPQTFDEAIVLAALARAHRRAHELALEQQKLAELQEFFDDLSNEEDLLMEEQPERVEPDDTWL